ncbi:MAG: FixH family protein [Xanthobacteraceae bacterium]
MAVEDTAGRKPGGGGAGNADSVPPLTGRRVLVYLLAFFAVVFAANGAMIMLAVDTLPGVEVDSAYRASLAFNSEIVRAQEQAARDWHVAAHVERSGDGLARLRLEARDARNLRLGGVAFSARLSRPTDQRADRVFRITEPEAGVYRGEAQDIGPGQWELIIEGMRGTERVFLSRNRLVLQ